jgi:DNA-binding MarR family transcriptional regulator
MVKTLSRCIRVLHTAKRRLAPKLGGMTTFSPEELELLPGFHIRRLQQIAVAVFMEETQDFAVTPVQFAALSAVLRQPAMDQRSLARFIGFDTSTIGSVIDRLEARGFMVRNASQTDKRVRLLTVTPAGIDLLKAAQPAVMRAQQRMLDPLPVEQRALFMQLVAQINHENEGRNRAPSLAASAQARALE